MARVRVRVRALVALKSEVLDEMHIVIHSDTCPSVPRHAVHRGTNLRVLSMETDRETRGLHEGAKLPEAIVSTQFARMMLSTTFHCMCTAATKDVSHQQTNGKLFFPLQVCPKRVQGRTWSCPAPIDPASTSRSPSGAGTTACVSNTGLSPDNQHAAARAPEQGVTTKRQTTFLLAASGTTAID